MRKSLIAIGAGISVSLLAGAVLAEPGGKGSRFEKLDANGDGKVTEQELAARRSAMIEAADQNGDGALTESEMHAFREAKRAERRAKRNPDKNGDGVIDRAEYDLAADERFERMDKNGDGVISEDERKRRHWRHRHGRHAN